MNRIKTIGFPRQQHEAREVRDFTPELFAFLQGFDVQVVAEETYGSGLGLAADAYRAANQRLTFGTAAQCFAADLVVVLRCPPVSQLALLRKGSALLSMLHFPTRPERVAFCEEAGVNGFAMDQVVDDLGRRLIENLDAVARNGVAVGMGALARNWSDFAAPSRGPLRVLVLGAGAVGAHALRWAVQYGDPEVRRLQTSRGVAGVEVIAVDVELTTDVDYVTKTLPTIDLLVDATQRRDTSVPVIRNAWLELMPKHAVIVDLAADPYDASTTPPRTKGVEGIPHGNLDQHVFEPADPAWDKLGPGVPTAARRTACSCYSWPGIRPLESSRSYGNQLQPVLRALIEQSPEGLSVTGGRMAERAVARSSHRAFRKGRA